MLWLFRPRLAHPSTRWTQIPAALAADAEDKYKGTSDLQAEVDRWRHARVMEYSAQLALVERLQAEIGSLRTKVCSQHDHAAVLTAQNRQLAKENLALKRELAEARRGRVDTSIGLPLHPQPSPIYPAETVAAAPPPSRASLRAEAGTLAANAYSGAGAAGTAPPPEAALSIDELQAEVSASLKPEHGLATMQLVQASAVAPQMAARLESRFEACRRQLSEPSLVLRLYLAGQPSMLHRLLTEGFGAAEPPAQPGGNFGRGWYFSRYASRAHCFTGGSGCLLLALVAVGNTETVVRRDGSRGAPSPGYDSIIIPGRPLPAVASALRGPSDPAVVSRGSYASAPHSEEYVIFDGSQAMPLYLLQYEVTVL